MQRIYNMKICVDYREQKKIPLFKDYIKSNKVKIINEVEIVPSQAGDVYTPDNLVGIERKHEDFLPSVYNKQLDKQLRELRNNFEYPFLFIEYEGLKDIILKNIGVNPEVIIGVIASVMARHKVTVCFVDDLYVPIVCKTIEKFYDGKSIIREQDYTPIRTGKPLKRDYTIQELKLDVVARIPHVGAQKGLKLLNHFDWSISKIANADADDFRKVAGIGEKISQQIKDVLR